ncbi:MAG: hypothetical protein JWM16_5716, partial [Verrucomicrobiales bacterium]|nr:hypothetical protein [Verrucomicrobiales bacterium]
DSFAEKGVFTGKNVTQGVGSQTRLCRWANEFRPVGAERVLWRGGERVCGIWNLRLKFSKVLGDQGTVLKTRSYMQSNKLLSRKRQPKNLTTLLVQKTEAEV